MDGKQSLPRDPPIATKRSAPKEPSTTGDTICPVKSQVLQLKPKDTTSKTDVPEKVRLDAPTIGRSLTIAEPAVIAERNGEVEYRVVYNDGGKDSAEILDHLRSIYRFQYPEMSKDYIERHVNDPEYRSIAIVRMPQETIGGITFRQLGTWNVAEVAFCAVKSEEQIKGYGAALMDHLKGYIKATSPVTHLLTYADNYHIGFSVKQGFARATLEESVWKECRKGYERVILMQCSVDGGIVGRQHKL